MSDPIDREIEETIRLYGGEVLPRIGDAIRFRVDGVTGSISGVYMAVARIGNLDEVKMQVAKAKRKAGTL